VDEEHLHPARHDLHRRRRSDQPDCREHKTVIEAPDLVRRRVRAVLEVNAGTARRLGIAPGDLVSHPMFAAKPK